MENVALKNILMMFMQQRVVPEKKRNKPNLLYEPTDWSLDSKGR